MRFLGIDGIFTATACPDCGKPMKFVAKLSWEMLDFMEGNCYVEVCPECQVASMHHQQT